MQPLQEAAAWEQLFLWVLFALESARCVSELVMRVCARSHTVAVQINCRSCMRAAIQTHLVKYDFDLTVNLQTCK